MSSSRSDAPTSAADGPYREVRYEHSNEFLTILRRQRISLLVSTYQAGKLVVLGCHNDQLSLSFHNFDQAMGVAIRPDQITVGGRSQIWTLQSTPDIVRQWPQPAPHDACYLARKAYVTDEIHSHEMQWCGDELWIVNTRFSCLCVLQAPYSFVPKWRPSFISQLAPEDRCHLNGMCVQNDRPRYVTAMAETDVAAGWRPHKATSGCLIDVLSGETVTRGFAMPHSPRIYNDHVFVLDSGRGQMVMVDPPSGAWQTVTKQPGYTRGLDFSGPYAFIGLSKIRETSTFGGVPIAERRDSLKCGVGVVDMRTGKHLAHFEFLSGVEEIFDVRVLPTAMNPLLTGPNHAAEGGDAIWYVPGSKALPTRLRATDSVALPRPAPPVNQVPPVNPAPSDGRSADASAAASFQRGVQHAEQDQFPAAEACFRQALQAVPEHVDSLWNLGVSLQYQGRLEESIAVFRRALKLHNELPAAHLNLAMSLLLNGDYAAGWQEYEWRWQCPRFSHRRVDIVADRWQGEDLRGRSLVVYGEQGIGDEIMFASCLPELLPRCGKLVLACQSRLVPLFKRSFPTAIAIAQDSLSDPETQRLLGPLDYQIAAGSLPQHVRPALHPDTAPEAFLVAGQDAKQRWQQRLQALPTGLNVGVSWRGGSEQQEIARRSTELRHWTKVFHQPGINFINLQYGVRQDELTAADQLSGQRFQHWPDSDPLRDMDDFAALVSSLDLVITIDNSTAHLAGALGVPTWMLISFPSSSYWRWAMSGPRCGWYAKLKIFRKQGGETWDASFAKVADELADALAQQRR